MRRSTVRAAPRLLLAACAAAPGDATTSASAGCAAGEPRIGTLVVRKETGLPPTPEERAALLGALGFGWLTDRIGRKKTLVLTLSLIVVILMIRPQGLFASKVRR